MDRTIKLVYRYFILLSSAFTYVGLKISMAAKGDYWNRAIIRIFFEDYAECPNIKYYLNAERRRAYEKGTNP